MIKHIAPDADYARPAVPGWRETDWRAHERDTIVDGRRIHYVDAGQGDRCFILVHGMGGRWQHWLETVPALAEHGRVLAIDLPGFGASELPSSPVSLDGFADAVAAVARHAGAACVVLVGHSMGGPIALRFAARHPDLAEAIVLVGGATYQFSALLGLRDIVRFTAERPRESVAIATEIATAGLPAPAAVRRAVVRWSWLRKLFLSPYVRDPVALPADTVRLVVDGAGARGVLPTAKAIGRSDPLGGLDAVACPILSLATSDDRIVPLGDTEAFQRDVPRARTVVLDGCGHMPMIERPQTFNSQVIAFADELG